MSIPEILSHVTSLLQSLGVLTYLQALLIISIAITLLYRLFDRGVTMPLEVLFATLLVGLTMTAFDSFPALIYVVVALNAGSLSNWLILTLAFLVFYLWRGVTRALQ